MMEKEDKKLPEENKEVPEIYSIRKGNDQWTVSRRSFLKAAGLGAAAVTAGLNAVRLSGPVLAANDLDTLCKTAAAHDAPLACLAISPDGSYFASSDQDGAVKLWSLPGGELLASVQTGGGVAYQLQFSGDSETLFCGTDQGQIEERAVSSALYLVDEGNFGTMINALATHPKDSKLAAARDAGELIMVDGTAMTWQPVDSDISISALCFTSTGQKLLAGGDSGKLTVYDTSDRQLLEAIEVGAPVTDLCILPGDVFAAVVDETPQLSVWSLASGEKKWSYPLPADMAPNAVVCTPDGSMIILKGTGKKILFISAADGTLLKEFAGGTEYHKTIAVTPDGSTLIAGFEQSILMYSLPDGKLTGCPVDLDSMPDTQEGITVEKVDEVTGETVTFTLPCGAPIPNGAVCVCNCVAGSVCSCVGYVACSCDGYVAGCSCDGHTITTTYHYWHPN